MRIDPYRLYNAQELTALTAGGDSYIRTKNNEVKGIAITLAKNPEAPDIIVVGDGPSITKNAELLANTVNAVPVFLKRGTNMWQYKGHYKVLRYSDSKSDIESHRKHRAAGRVSGILFMQKVL